MGRRCRHSKEGAAQVENDGFSQLQRQSLAEVHHDLSADGQDQECRGPEDNALDIALGDGALDHGGHQPSEGWQLDRAEDDQNQEPVAFRRVGMGVGPQAANQLQVERPRVLLAIFRAANRQGLAARHAARSRRRRPADSFSAICSSAASR